MNIVNKALPRFMSLNSEAARRSTADMWRVRADQPFLPRLAKTALGAALRPQAGRHGIHRFIAKRLDDGAEVIGCGYDQLVLARGASVAKYLLRTLGMDRVAIEDLAAQLQLQHEEVAEHLGGHWVPTHYGIHELKGSSVVVATQPRLADASFYHKSRDIVSGPETARLAELIHELHSSTALYPDVLGPDNIARTPDGLCFVDTLPITPESQAQIDVIAGMPVGRMIELELERWAA